MFRKIFAYSALFVFCFQFMFCRTNDSETDEVLIVTPTEMKFSAYDGEKRFRVDTKYRMAWQIDSTLSAKWVHVKTNENNEMFIVVDENLSGVERSSIVEVTTVNKEYQKVITVVQKTLEAHSLEISKDTITLYTNVHPMQFTITADGEWHLDLIPEWLDIQRVDSISEKTALEVVAQSSNITGDMRSQFVSVVYGLGTKQLLIRQWGNVDAHIYSEVGTLQSILSQDRLFQTIETLALEGVIDYSDFEILRQIEKLRVLNLQNIQISGGQINLPAFVLKSHAHIEEVTIPSGTNTLTKGLFMDCTQLRKITLTKNITLIEELAFAGCHSLVSLRLPKALTKIEAEAFKGCFVKELILESEIPPELGEAVFDATTFETCLVTVPKGSLDAYKSDKDWMNFLNLKELE